MFCSNCGKQAGANDAFCGKCGKPLMAGTDEAIKKGAGTAFDTAGPGGAKYGQATAVKPKSGGDAIYLFIFGIIVAGIIVAVVTNDGSDGGSSSSGSSGFRNCIKDIHMVELPDCSDGPGGDGTPKQTKVNNTTYPSCRRVSASGQCIK